MIVAETDVASPARVAGVQARDRIVRVNDVPVTARTEEDLPDVRRLLALLPRGEPARFELVRGDVTVTLELTPREKGRVEGAAIDCPRWDLTVKAINQFDSPDLYFYRREGVFVYGVRMPGNAARAGLRSQDILLAVDGQPVTDLESLKKIHRASLEHRVQKPRLILSVLRGGAERVVVLDVSRDYTE